MKIISDKKTGFVISTCKSEGFEVIGRKIYTLDDNGERHLKMSFSEEGTFETIEIDESEIDESELPEDIKEKSWKYKVDENKKLKLKDAE